MIDPATTIHLQIWQPPSLSSPQIDLKEVEGVDESWSAVYLGVYPR
jgi:hypothetical protein